MEIPTIEELATAVREYRMEFQEALLLHLEHRHPEHHDIEGYLVLMMAISYCTMGQPETTLELAGEQATAEEFVRRFDLEAFLE